MKCHRQCLLLQVIFFIANCLAENLIFNINFKKPITVTDHAFLSFTLDPTTLQHNDFIQNIERSTNLARGLAPAYIRFGGPQSNFYNFEQANSHEINTNLNDTHFGTEWTLIYQWAKNAGLDIIVCITPLYIDNELKTDPKDSRNIAELLSFSDRMGYNISWQLGYECQTRCDLSGRKLGQYVANLREILKTFPRYSNSLIIGPDIQAYKTAQQQKYLQDYLHSANTALSAITWHPNLNSISLNNDNISINYDNIIAEKDEMYNIISHVATKKPLWIAESKSEENKHQYLGALIWTKRLGDAAKLGVQVVMRQLSNLSRATPDYWVSLLYKTLVGREVLEMKLQSENESPVYFYSQCTKSSALYTKGAITIFGINLTPNKVTVSLKDFKIQILHKYILSPDFKTDNKMFSEKVLLNNKSLHFINNKKLPEINPEIIISPNSLDLELASGSIGFWVIPNAKVNACMCSEEETIDNNTAKKSSKRHKSDIKQNNQKEKEDDINQSNNSKETHKIPIHEDLIKGKRFKRHLDRKLENSNKRILKKRSRIANLKDHVVKQKIKRGNDNRKEISFDNSKKNFDDDENKYNDLLQRNPVKRFFKNDVFKNAGHHIDYQLMPKSERTRRDINKKLIEIDLRRDSLSRKRSRLDDLRNYVNERKAKQKDIIKKEGLLNSRITDSDENDFYGFFRRDPVKGFPEGDIFMTTGDSLEQNRNDYDYVEDENNGNDNSEKKNTQYNQKSMLGHTEDNTSVKEVEDDHCDYIPNEFFENIKLSNTKIKENFKNYDDLGEAEFPLEEHNNNTNNNNKITATEVIREHSSNEEKEKHVRETNMQYTQLINPDDDFNKQEYDRDTLASRYSSIPFDQLSKTLTSNFNYQASNVKLKEAKLNMEPEIKISNSFYLPSKVSTARYNYDNYETSNINHDKIQLKDEKDFVTNIDNRDDINAKTTQYFRPTSVYAEHPIAHKILHNKRSKRSNWKELQKIFSKEMLKEDEENARDCHCRVIRASDSPKKFYYHRVKRNISNSVSARLTDTSLENKNVNTDLAQSEENIQTLKTREEYEEIMTGEVLSSTNIIEPISEENDTTTESVITESNTLDHELSDTTQASNVISISEMDNISKQYHDMKKSTTNLLPMDSASEISLNNNNSVKYTRNETFFRAQPSENETKTYDSLQVISKIPSENTDNREEFNIFVTKYTQETSEKALELINEKEKADNLINLTITEDQKNEEKRNNNYKTEFNSTDSLKETSKEIVEQVTTETILSKRAVNTTIDNSKSNESKKNTKLSQNIEDNQNSELKARKAKDANIRRLKTILKNYPRISLEGFNRYEEHLMKRAEEIDKRKEKLCARREKLLHQYQNELTKITDEQKRNLKRREIKKEKGHDNFHRLIDQGAFIGVRLNDDVSCEDDDENYLIPIEVVPKQYNNIIDQIYLLTKAKKVHYPEHNKYYQFLRNLIKDDEKLTEMSKSVERKYNQYYWYIPKIFEDKRETETSKFLDHEDNCQHSSKVEDEQGSIESTSRSSDRKVFIIDPATYYGGEPILQSHEDYLKLPKYHSKIKSHIQDPTSRWILRNFHQVLPKLKSSEDQHEASKTQEYVKILPTNDYNKDYCNRKIGDIIKKTMENKEFVNDRKIDINSKSIKDAEEVVKIKKSENIEATKHEETNEAYNSNNKTEDNLNIKMFNNNKTDEHVEKIIDDLKARELEKENMRNRRGRKSEEFEYEDLSNLTTENTENISGEESLCENEKNVSTKDDEAELENDERYEITSDEINKYLEIGSNERGIFLLFPWKDMKKINENKNEINEDINKM